MPVVLAIDPGIHGALSWVSADGHLIETDDMPVIEVRGKNKINAAELCRMLERRPVDLVAIEGVMAMPTPRDGGKVSMGASSAFSFGYGAGLLEGVATGLGLPVVLHHASTWKKKAEVPTDKGAARQMASRLWPGAADRFKRVKDDGRAESALLARWVALAMNQRAAA